MRSSVWRRAFVFVALSFFTHGSLTAVLAQADQRRGDASQDGPWYEAYIIFSDGQLFGGEIAFRNAVATPERGAVEEAALSDTLWLCSESYTELVPARSADMLLVLFQYGPVTSWDDRGRAEIGRRVAVVNSEHSAFVVTVCGLGRLSRPLPVTTSIVARDDTNEQRTFYIEEFFFTPRFSRASEAARIEAILFRR